MLYTFYSMLQRDLPDQLEKHVLRASETNTYKTINSSKVTNERLCHCEHFRRFFGAIECLFRL